MGCHFLLQGIFPTQGSNLHLLCLLHWQVGSLSLEPPGKSRLCVYLIRQCYITSRFYIPINSAREFLNLHISAKTWQCLAIIFARKTDTVSYNWVFFHIIVLIHFSLIINDLYPIINDLFVSLGSFLLYFSWALILFTHKSSW